MVTDTKLVQTVEALASDFVPGKVSSDGAQQSSAQRRAETQSGTEQVDFMHEA